MRLSPPKIASRSKDIVLLALRFLVLALALVGVALTSDPAVADTDTDGDGYSDAVENFIGTNPNAPCSSTTAAGDEELDAWPPDFNDDTRVNIADLVLLRNVYGASAGDPEYDPRFDLNTDGKIGVSDVVLLRPVYNTSCEPFVPPTPTPAVTATSEPTPTPTPPPPPPTQPPSPPGTFLATFDGIDPSSALSAYYMQDWDISIHSRDNHTYEELDDVQAQHGADCSPPPATHEITAYEDAVYLCKNHLMTAMNADGYGVIYLTPNALVDFSGGEAVIRFDMSTLRTSGRDWWDVYVMPFDDALKLPLEPWLPDLEGYPRNAIKASIAQHNNNTTFGVDVITNFDEDSVDGCWWCGVESNLAPSPTRRDTVELRISRTHVKFGMPDYNFWPVDEDIPALAWTQGVVQFGHHSYNPSKAGCGAGSNAALAGVSCGEGNTWHWDNFEINPAVPYTIIRGDRRFVDAGTPSVVNFSAPAPAGSKLRFSAMGGANNSSFEIRFNGGAWQTPSKHPSSDSGNGMGSYFVPVPTGTTNVEFRGSSGRFAKDFAIMSLAPPAQVSASFHPAAEPVQFVRTLESRTCEMDHANGTVSRAATLDGLLAAIPEANALRRPL